MLLYATDQYISIHDSESVFVTENEYFRICLHLSDKTAFGFRFSPIGALINKVDANYSSFEDFEDQLESSLRAKDINKISLRQPPHYYPQAIPNKWLSKSGYKLINTDLNQYIELGSYHPDQMHLMEQRKLLKSQEFNFQMTIEPVDHLAEIHEFISLCRKAQGLQINIGFERLETLFEAFPLNYSVFSLRYKGEIICAVVTVQPLEDVIYYFLPATHPKHKSKSPMVFLMSEMIAHYQSKGIRIMDLGLSTIDGGKQQGLFTFKKRMGAQSAESLLFEKQLS